MYAAAAAADDDDDADDGSSTLSLDGFLEETTNAREASTRVGHSSRPTCVAVVAVKIIWNST